MIATVTGTALIGGELLLTACKNSNTDVPASGFTNQELGLINEVADTMLPTTASSPGAKAANVADPIARIVNDCYSDDQQKIFHDGLASLAKKSEESNGKSFIDSSAEERTAMLQSLQKEARDQQTSGDGKQPPHYFTMMQQLALLSYYNSEIGCKQAMRFDPVPGRYDGCIDYSVGDKAFCG